jgi:DNA-binding SARP family transcriptional activator
VRFRILGPLEIWTGQDWSGIGAPKWRALLAALLLNPGQVVSTERLIAELWDDDPPDRAANLVSVYVLRLRRMMGDPRGGMLARRAPGYQLRLDPGDLDAAEFEVLLAQGRQALAGGDSPRAAALLAEALALWQGDALADIPPTGLITAEADRLEAQKLTALELRITADLRCGLAAQVVPELRRVISDHQLREGLWVLLLQALDSSGRRAEAVATYGEARGVIAEELGVEPGPELRGIYQQLLDADVEAPGPSGPGAAGPGIVGPGAAGTGAAGARPASTGAAGTGAAGTGIAGTGAAGTGPAGTGAVGTGIAGTGAAGTGAAGTRIAGRGVAPAGQSAAGHPGTAGRPGDGGHEAASPPAVQDPGLGTAAWPEPALPDGPRVPAQLPADIADFTGRVSHLIQLRGLLAVAARGDGRAAMTVAVVAGTPGLGKTTLAVHAAHALRREFPGGQLYVGLRGASAQPARPEEVLARLLRDLGVPPDQIPAAPEERAALYRTRLTDRRVLIVLDDARDAAQVRPLLPGSASCAVIVTARHRLADLSGSRLVDLDVLDDDEARRLLTAIIGEERTAAEPGPVRDVLDACAGLPLAIRIAGARLTARRGWAVRTLARRLADQRRRVDELTEGDMAVRACFDVSFESLRHLATGAGVDPSHAFRLLGTWQGPSISLQAAAALLGEPEDPVADALEVLVDAHLLESPEPEWYKFHDLLRAYAAERAEAQEPPQTVTGGLDRVLRWYLATADAAASVVAPYRDRVPDAAADGALTFATADEALDWTRRERANLVAATRQAADSGLHDVAWKLPVAIMACFDRHGYRTEWITTHRIALPSARAAADQAGEAWVLHNIGMALSQQQSDDAIGYLQQALELRRQLGDRRGQAQAANNIAFDYQLRGMHAQAIPALQDALKLQRQVGHRYGEGVALCNLSEAYLELGRYQEAISSSQEALPIVQEAKSTRVEGYVLLNLGRAHMDLGNLVRGADLLRRALVLHQAEGDKFGEAQDLQHLGLAAVRGGQPLGAREPWERAIELFEIVGDDKHAAQVRANLHELSMPASGT